MTSQEKIRYLRQYRVAEQEVQRTLAELERLRSLAEKCTANVSGSPMSGNSSDKIQSAVENMAEWERLLDEQTRVAIQIRNEIECAIESVKEYRLHLLLKYRYIDGLAWERLAEAMKLELRWVYRLHARALSKLTIESHY